jgi:hypothetical protein
MSDWDDISGKVQDQVVNKSDALAAISGLVDELVELKAKKLKLETKLEEQNERMKQLEEVEIPDLMDSVSMAQLKTSKGHTVSVEVKIRASLPEATRPMAFAWIEGTGNGGIIKREIAVAFSRDQEDAAAELKDELVEKGYENVKTDRWVEPATLTKFVSDRLKNGEEVPKDIVTVFEQKKVKIK